METEKFKELITKAYAEGQLKGYEEGIDAMIEMLKTFRESFHNLKEQRKIK
jgi:hypothetical protein